MIVQVLVTTDDGDTVVCHVIVYADEGQFVAECPSFPRCEQRGSSLDEVLSRIHDAVAAHLRIKAS